MDLSAENSADREPSVDGDYRERAIEQRHLFDGSNTFVDEAVAVVVFAIADLALSVVDSAVAIVVFAVTQLL